MTDHFEELFGPSEFIDQHGDPVEFVVIDSYSSSIGWKEDGSLRVEENGKEVVGKDAERVLSVWGMAVGWPILQHALDPDGTKRADSEEENTP